MTKRIRATVKPSDDVRERETRLFCLKNRLAPGRARGSVAPDKKRFRRSWALRKDMRADDYSIGV